MNYVYTNPQCSSGCESGWTLYFEQSNSIYPYDQEKNDFFGETRNRVYDSQVREEEEEEEEDHEDLSMVSDASSGPPHFVSEEQEEGYNNGRGIDSNNGFFYHFSDDSLLSRKGASKQKIRENDCKKVKDDQYSALLDDTASSTLLDFSTTKTSQPLMDNVLEYSSQGYSTTYSEVKVSYDNKEHYDFFKSSPLSGNHIQQNQWYEGKRC